MTLAITEARESDVEAILAMASALSAHEGMPEPDLAPETLRQVMFGTELLVGGLIARQDGEIAGYALWSRGFDMQEGVRTLHLIDLYVEPRHRRGGIAAALVRHLAGRARRRSIGAITVSAMAGNVEANGFYRAMGAIPEADNSYCFTRRRIEELSA